MGIRAWFPLPVYPAEEVRRDCGPKYNDTLVQLLLLPQVSRSLRPSGAFPCRLLSRHRHTAGKGLRDAVYCGVWSHARA